MTARLGAFDDQGVGAVAHQFLGDGESRREADQRRAELLHPAHRRSGRNAAGEHDAADVLFAANFDQLREGRMHDDQVHAEGLLRLLPRRLNLGAQQVGRHRAAGEDPEAAGVGDRGDQIAFRHPGHRAAQNRMLDAEQRPSARRQRFDPLQRRGSVRSDLAHADFVHIGHAASSP